MNHHASMDTEDSSSEYVLPLNDRLKDQNITSIHQDQNEEGSSMRIQKSTTEESREDEDLNSSDHNMDYESSTHTQRGSMQEEEEEHRSMGSTEVQEDEERDVVLADNDIMIEEAAETPHPASPKGVVNLPAPDHQSYIQDIQHRDQILLHQHDDSSCDHPDSADRTQEQSVLRRRTLAARRGPPPAMPLLDHPELDLQTSKSFDSLTDYSNATSPPSRVRSLLLRRSLAWSQDSNDDIDRSCSKRAKNFHHTAPSPNNNNNFAQSPTSPSFVHWDAKVDNVASYLTPTPTNQTTTPETME